MHDCDMARVSGFDDHRLEHWIEFPYGKGYRERRDKAVIQIMSAIEDGHLPGQLNEE